MDHTHRKKDLCEVKRRPAKKNLIFTTEQRIFLNPIRLFCLPGQIAAATAHCCSMPKKNSRRFVDRNAKLCCPADRGSWSYVGITFGSMEASAFSVFLGCFYWLLYWCHRILKAATRTPLYSSKANLFQTKVGFDKVFIISLDVFNRIFIFTFLFIGCISVC